MQTTTSPIQAAQDLRGKLIDDKRELLAFVKRFQAWSERAPLNSRINNGQLYSDAKRLLSKFD